MGEDSLVCSAVSVPRVSGEDIVDESRTASPVSEDEHRRFHLYVTELFPPFFIYPVERVQNMLYAAGKAEFAEIFTVYPDSVAYLVECLPVRSDKGIYRQGFEFEQSHCVIFCILHLFPCCACMHRPFL